MFWKTTNEKYTGHWDDGYQSGFGTHIWLEGSGENKLLRNRYVGYWRKGLRHGQGTFYYSNGSKYEGEWSDNLKHGIGVFTFEDGTTYHGPFENDRMVNRSLQGVAQIGNIDSERQETSNSSPNKKVKVKPKGGKDDKAANVVASTRTKKEVESNPFKVLIDISDLVELEDNPAEVEKDVQNILLRYNSDIKKWYKYYSKKVENVKSEESFALTLRQIWRFFRDVQVISPDATLAIINRVFNQGRKNHFTILGEKDKHKFHLIANKVGEWRPTTDQTNEKHTAPIVESNSRVENNPSGNNSSIPKNPAEISQNVGDSYIIEKADNIKIESSKLDMLDSDSEEEIEEFMDLDAENIHDSSKPILQRQFFEAIVRACHVSYANVAGFKTLADKLDDMMKNRCAPFATKSKAKNPDDEKNFKLAEKVFEMLEKELIELFNNISKRKAKPSFGVIDKTIDVEDLVRFLARVEVLWNETPKQKEMKDPSHNKTEQVVQEHHEEIKHDSKNLNETSKSKAGDKSKIITKVDEEKIEPPPAHEEKEEIEQESTEVDSCPPDRISLVELISIIEKYYNPTKTLARVIDNIHPEDPNREYNIHKLTNRYYVQIKGSELILHEFKEILLDISILLKEKTMDTSGKQKVRSLLKRFIEESLIKRYAAFKDIDAAKAKIKETKITRQWPDSYKDKLIKERKEAERIKQAEEKKRKEEEEKQQRELEQMKQEDTPALSLKQLEDLRKQQEYEEKLRKEQEEADALDEEDEDELEENQAEEDESIEGSEI